MKTTQITRIIASTIAAFAIYFVWQLSRKAYKQRLKVRKLKSEGIYVLPHSWIFGHLPIVWEFARTHPPDVSFYVLHLWILKHAKRFFPKLDGRVPAVVYMDLWPVTENYALVYDGYAATQFTVQRSLNKNDIVRDFLVYMTQTHDLFSSDGQIWKTWRQRFNPGFSPRNILSMVPELIEEVSVFTDMLKKRAGASGSWGDVFSLEPKTTSLTFDIIVRAIVGIRLHDQSTETGAPLKLAMVEQINLMNEMPIVARGRLPFTGNSRARLRRIDELNKIMHSILLKPIEAALKNGRKSSSRKTAVDLAIKYIDEDEAGGGLGAAPEVEFIDRVIANLKVMMFAGHDTTSATICFMFKCLQDNPQKLSELRAEHDAILGHDPEDAANVIQANPNLLYSLPYTLGVIKETLRLNPLASTMRDGVPDFYINSRDDPATKYPIDGWAPWVANPATHRSEDYWPRPNEFLPERWCVKEGHPLYVTFKEAWTPFSVGPRSCIGMELALTELRLVSVFTARQFDVKEGWEAWDVLQGPKATPSHMVDGERLYHTGNSTVHPKDGMPVHVRTRVHNASAAENMAH